MNRHVQMKTIILTCMLVALLVGATVLSVGAAETSGAAGAVEVNLIQNIFTGFLGRFAGLLVVFIGVYSFFAKGNTSFGLTLMVVGVGITLFPSIYNGFRAITCPIVSSITGSSTGCPVTAGIGHSGDDNEEEME